MSPDIVKHSLVKATQLSQGNFTFTPGLDNGHGQLLNEYVILFRPPANPCFQN